MELRYSAAVAVALRADYRVRRQQGRSHRQCGGAEQPRSGSELAFNDAAAAPADSERDRRAGRSAASALAAAVARLGEQLLVSRASGEFRGTILDRAAVQLRLHLQPV